MSEPNDEPCEQPRAIIFWSLVTSPIFTLLSLLSKNDLRSEEDERIMSKAIILQFVYNKGIAKGFKGFTIIFLVHPRRPSGSLPWLQRSARNT